MSEMIAILFSVALAENLVFAQGNGTTMMGFQVSSVKDLLRFTAFFFPTTLASSLLCLFIDRWLKETSFASLFLFFAFLVLGGILWVSLRFLAPYLLKENVSKITYQSMWLFVCIAYVALRSNYLELTILNTFLYVLGSTIGLVLGGVVLLALWPRLSKKIPKGMQGFPIRLLTISLVGMIFVLFS